MKNQYGNQCLKLWTVYFNPTDHPGQFVARRFDGDKPTEEFHTARRIETVRRWIFKDAKKFGQGTPVNLERAPNDDPCIVETWI